MSPNQDGYQLLELLVVLFLASFLVVFAVPRVIEWSSGVRVELAAGEISSALTMARLFAVRYSANVAVKFRTYDQGRVTYALYRDGDGDGVRNRDIDRGIDPLVQEERPLAMFGDLVRFGFPAGPAPRDPSDPRRRLDRLHDPIRFNRSDLASFAATGTSTPGTVYLSDGRRHLAAVRVNNLSGKVVVLLYDPEREIWR